MDFLDNTQSYLKKTHIHQREMKHGRCIKIQYPSPSYAKTK